MVSLKRQGWAGLLKGSLVGAIVPSSGTQPHTHLLSDGALPCKVVINSPHTFPRHLMSVQNTHVIPASLIRFSSILYINKCIIALYLIFGSFVHYR